MWTEYTKLYLALKQLDQIENFEDCDDLCDWLSCVLLSADSRLLKAARIARLQE